jgi:perosamine synthetase
MDMFLKTSEPLYEPCYDYEPLKPTVEDIVEAIESVLSKRRPIEHHEPFINKKKANIEIANCIANGIHKYDCVERFENWLKDFTGAQYALATNTGTSALHVALLAAGVKHGDEVIVPTSTFVATANAVSHAGAVPHFIDGAPHIDPEYLRKYLEKQVYLNEDKKRFAALRDKYEVIYPGPEMGIKTKHGSIIRAIIVVHLLGLPAKIEEICKIAKEFNLVVIEDASQALGTRVNGKHVGTFGWAGTFSFNNNKIIATGGGGAVITNSANLHYDAKQLSSTARKPHQWLVEHESMAWNYRMGSINAALGLVQADEIKKTLTEKQNLAQRYRKALNRMVEFVEPNIECQHNYWLNTILVDNIDELLEALHRKGIRARCSFTPLHLLPFYKYSLAGKYSYQYNVQEGQMPEAVDFFNRAVCLPSGSGL